MRVAELLAIDLDKALCTRGGRATYIASLGEWVSVKPSGDAFERYEFPDDAAAMFSQLCPDGTDYAKLLRQESGAEAV